MEKIKEEIKKLMEVLTKTIDKLIPKTRRMKNYVEMKELKMETKKTKVLMANIERMYKQDKEESGRKIDPK